MARYSKWAKVNRCKAGLDAQRGKIFAPSPNVTDVYPSAEFQEN